MRSILVLSAGVLVVLAIEPVACGGGGDGDGTAGRAPDAASGGSGGTQGVDGAGWPDSPASDGSDATLEGASDAPPESGDASDGATSNGCRDGVRRGFTSLADFPSVAACGDPVGYADAVTNAATACDVGWHFCTPSASASLAPRCPISSHP